MELKYPENIKKSLMESIIDSVKSLDSITVHNPFFFSFIPHFFVFLPPKNCILLLRTFKFYIFFHCGDNMIKINPFSMAFSKTYCLFHFQTEICFFYIFNMVNIWPPKKM